VKALLASNCVCAHEVKQESDDFCTLASALMQLQAQEDTLHPGRGHSKTGHRSDKRAYVRKCFLAEYEDNDDAAFAMFRFSVPEIRNMASDPAIKNSLEQPRPMSHQAADAAAAAVEPRPARYYRPPTTALEDRLAAVLTHTVHPETPLDELAMRLGVSSATASLQLRCDVAALLSALRDELPVLVHPAVVRQELDTMGLLVGAHLIVDTTDTAIQQMTNTFNVHHKLHTTKSLVVVAHDGTLMAVEVGYAGGESDLTIFRQSQLYQRLHAYLFAGERLFLGDGIFRHDHVYFPLSKPELAAEKDPVRHAALETYNKELQLYRARVEHAIGKAKGRFGALRSIPARSHMKLEDLINLVFLAWLLEARYARLHPELV
jgi:hypothetical protein